jgi:Uma2 family endonuclease
MPPGLTEEQFLQICHEFPEDRVEYNAREAVTTVIPFNDPATAHCSSNITYQLFAWQRSTRRGMVSDSSAGFHFPDGSRMGPDAAWFDEQRWESAQEPGTNFPVFAPEFVIELRSPTDRIRPLREKMDDYIRNGVQLAWLIDPKERTVTIYKPGAEPVVLDQPTHVRGEGPVEGFVLDLDGIL